MKSVSSYKVYRTVKVKLKLYNEKPRLKNKNLK